MKKQSKKLTTNLKIEELLPLVEELLPSEAEKIRGGEGVDTDGNGILDTSMSRKTAESLGYKCTRWGCGDW